MVKRLSAGIVAGAILAGMFAGPASATPLYWYRSQHTARNGWVVKAGNDSYTRTIRTHCSWWAGGGPRWTLTWVIGPRQWYWAPSDAGNWGNYRPQGLRCSYVVIG